MILKIVQVGAKVLRENAAEVDPSRIKTPAFQQLLEMMRATMLDAPGVGLAAPQVGVGLRVAVIEDRAETIALAPPEEVARKERRPVPFHVIINPTLTVVDATDATFVEGCLSVTGFAAEVSRAKAVQVKALDHTGAPVTIDAHGWYARILQHEIDHLNGNLYIDRMNPRTFFNTAFHTR